VSIKYFPIIGVILKYCINFIKTYINILL
jgi:hypothetical protein